VIKKKICMLGAYAVGKTSLVRRFVEDRFSDRYVTTIGVKITKRELVLDGTHMTLMLWDLHGDDAFQTVQMSYLRGSSGLLFVADSTRPETLDQVSELRARAAEALGDVPRLLLFNKSDLISEPEPDSAELAAAWAIHRTSAKTGEGVEAAFQVLGRRMVTGS
jgi:small GTP-binding protein